MLEFIIYIVLIVVLYKIGKAIYEKSETKRREAAKQLKTPKSVAKKATSK